MLKLTDFVSCLKISINIANYLVRQSFIFENIYLDYYERQKTLYTQVDYKAIPVKVSQQILIILERNTEEFFS